MGIAGYGLRDGTSEPGTAAASGAGSVRPVEGTTVGHGHDRGDGIDESGTVGAALPRRSSVRRIRAAERLRNSMTAVPLMGMLVGWLLARLLSGRELNDSIREQLDTWYSTVTGSQESWIWFSAATFQTVTGTVATAMLTFIGVVFSLTILGLQVASSQLSPRIMRTFVRSNVVTATLAVFMATLVYAITTLSAIQPGNDAVDPFEPFIAYYVLLVLVGATLVMFIGYVSHVVRLIRIHHILDQVVDETSRAIERCEHQVQERRDVPAPASAAATTVITAGRHGVVNLVDVHALAAIGDRTDSVIRLRARVGDHLAAPQVLAEVTGGGVRPGEIRRQVHLAPDRTVRQDPAFGLRQIVDVATRALSPAVNDPTTAVQAIDRITELLFELGDRPDPPDHWLGATGTVRVVQPARSWDDLVDLSFEEIREFGAGSVQISRRLAAALDDLTSQLAPRRAAALERQRTRLTQAVRALDPPDPAHRLVPDRSGIG